MNEILTVDYETEVAIEAKSTEQLTAEINVRYRQAESLAAMSATMLADAGRRLIEIKNRIPHGSFEQWCADNLEFSKSKAEKMMMLAEKMQDEKSIFSKTETFTDLRISTVWALLAAPEEIAVEVVETEDVSELTIRELKEKIRELTAEKEAQADNQITLDQLQAQLDAKETERAEAVKAKDKTAEKLAKAQDKLKALKEKQAEEVEKAIKEREAQLKEEARAEVSKKLKDSEEDIKDLEEEVDRLTKRLQNSENEELAKFRVQANIMQQTFNECLGVVFSISNENTAASMKQALRKILDMQIKALEE